VGELWTFCPLLSRRNDHQGFRGLALWAGHFVHPKNRDLHDRPLARVRWAAFCFHCCLSAVSSQARVQCYGLLLRRALMVRLAGRGFRKAAKREILKEKINARSTTVENSFNENPTNKEENRKEENRVESKETTPSSGDDSPAKKSKADAPNFQGIADLYNELLGEFLPLVEVMNDGRKRTIRARWKQKWSDKSHGNEMR